MCFWIQEVRYLQDGGAKVEKEWFCSYRTNVGQFAGLKPDTTCTTITNPSCAVDPTTLRCRSHPSGVTWKVTVHPEHKHPELPALKGFYSEKFPAFYGWYRPEILAVLNRLLYILERRDPVCNKSDLEWIQSLKLRRVYTSLLAAAKSSKKQKRKPYGAKHLSLAHAGQQEEPAGDSWEIALLLPLLFHEGYDFWVPCPGKSCIRKK
jgi:hypothetical protein